MADLRNFTISSPRPLPVLVLADISGSMSQDGKIEVLNRSIKDMAKSFAEASTSRVDIQMAVITFGGEQAIIHKELSSTSNFTWVDMSAGGKTPLGAAFILAKEMIEDKQVIPSRAYTPTIILASDARPTDTVSTANSLNWQESLQKLLSSERASKASRYALAIGEDADFEVLREFVGDQQKNIFKAGEVGQISRFFNYVTMSVTSRSRSANPNYVKPTETDDFDY